MTSPSRRSAGCPRRGVLLLALLLGIVVAPVSVAPAPARAGVGATSVPLKGFAAIVTDAARGRAYVSDGIDRVTVIAADGSKVATIAGLPSAGSLALDPDGRTLWVATPTRDAIASVDLDTLAVTFVPTGAQSCPAALAVAGGLVIYLNGGSCNGTPRIVGWDPVHRSSIDLTQEFGNSGLPLLSDPGLPQHLISCGGYGTTATVWRVDPTRRPVLTSVATRDDLNGCLTVASGGGAAIDRNGNRMTLPSLTPLPGQVVGALAMSADGEVARTQSGSLQLVFVRSGESTPWTGYGGFDGFSGAAYLGSDLVVVVRDARDAPSAVIVRPLRKVAVTLTMRKNAYTAGDAIPVTVHLEGVDGPTEVEVQTTPDTDTAPTVRKVTTDASGTAQIALKLSTSQLVRAVYAGDDAHDPARTGWRQVVVNPRVDVKLAGGAGSEGRYRLYRQGQPLVVIGKVFPAHSDSCFQVRIAPVPHRANEEYYTRGCIPGDAQGRVRAKIAFTGPQPGDRFRVELDWSAPRTNPVESPYVYFKMI